MTVELLTFDDMKESFFDRIGEESDNSRWQNETVERWINEGQLDVVTKTRCLEERWTTSVGAWADEDDEIVTFPPEFYDDGLINVWWVDSDGTYHPLHEVDPAFETIENDSDNTNTPKEYIRIGRNIHLRPVPNAAGTVCIVGHRKPDKLTIPTHQSLIEAAYRHLPVIYAACQAFLEDEEYGKYDRTLARYERDIRTFRGNVQKRRAKGPSQFRFPQYLRAR